MASEDAALCDTCGITFRARDAGFLGCRVHPQTLNPDTGHFPCCGSAPRGSPCATHAECSRDAIGGCHLIDHCATSEEKERILHERPFVVGPLDQALTQMPYASKPDDARVFHVTRAEQLDTPNFTVPVSRAWQGGGIEVDGRLRVDLRAEHETLRTALIEREYEAAHAPIEAITAANDLSDPYASEWVRHAVGVEDISTPHFVPFAIIMRIGARRKYVRGAGRTPCVWKD